MKVQQKLIHSNFLISNLVSLNINPIVFLNSKERTQNGEILCGFNAFISLIILDIALGHLNYLNNYRYFKISMQQKLHLINNG
jgi:hypothetical protein